MPKQPGRRHGEVAWQKSLPGRTEPPHPAWAWRSCTQARRKKKKRKG